MVAEDALNKIEATSSTNLCGGLLEGVNQMRERVGTQNQVASVMLFTDGLLSFFLPFFLSLQNKFVKFSI